MVRDDGTRRRIYLIVEPTLEAPALRDALSAPEVACVLLCHGGLDEEPLRAAVEALRPVAQERDVAFLIEDRAALAGESGCDGIHLSAGGAVAAARREVGADAIVGVSCGDSRHAAMTAGEAGADYVAFGGGAAAEAPSDAADPEVLAWWQATMTIPCVAMGGVGLDNAGDLARSGADFVAVGRTVWDHPEGAAAALRRLASHLAAAGG